MIGVAVVVLLVDVVVDVVAFRFFCLYSARQLCHAI